MVVPLPWDAAKNLASTAEWNPTIIALPTPEELDGTDTSTLCRSWKGGDGRASGDIGRFGSRGCRSGVP
jgi:hypothetical protein